MVPDQNRWEPILPTSKTMLTQNVIAMLGWALVLIVCTTCPWLTEHSICHSCYADPSHYMWGKMPALGMAEQTGMPFVGTFVRTRWSFTLLSAG